jgi:cytochrome c-type biogenesis protein CcmH/NrfG
MRTVLAALNAAVHSALARFDYVSAAFLAERLVAVARTEASARGAGARPDETADEVHARALLGLVYYRSGKPQKAAALLRGCTDDEGRYLLAFCLFEQDRFNDAEAVLLPDIPNGAAG